MERRSDLSVGRGKSSADSMETVAGIWEKFFLMIDRRGWLFGLTYLKTSVSFDFTTEKAVLLSLPNRLEINFFSMVAILSQWISDCLGKEPVSKSGVST